MTVLHLIRCQGQPRYTALLAVVVAILSASSIVLLLITGTSYLPPIVLTTIALLWALVTNYLHHRDRKRVVTLLQQLHQ